MLKVATEGQVMAAQLILAMTQDADGIPHYTGQIDGKWGPLSESAARRLLESLVPEKETVSESDHHQDMPDNAVLAFFLSKDGDKYVSEHFQVREFACRDGSDPVFIHAKIPDACELARTINGAFSPSSSYRTPAHNSSVDGATSSQHMLGYAVDIPTEEATPEELYELFDAEHQGGLGIYSWGIHVDFGPNRRWDSR